MELTIEHTMFHITKAIKQEGSSTTGWPREAEDTLQL